MHSSELPSIGSSLVNFHPIYTQVLQRFEKNKNNEKVKMKMELLISGRGNAHRARCPCRSSEEERESGLLGTSRDYPYVQTGMEDIQDVLIW